MQRETDTLWVEKADKLPRSLHSIRPTRPRHHIYRSAKNNTMRALITLATLFLAGCAATVSREHSVPTTSNRYAISFHQSPSREFGGQSFYEIRVRESDSLIGRVPSEIKVDQRGVDDRPLRVGRDFRPLAVSSPSGRTIIITEDCWEAIPFNTYLVIRLSEGKIASSVYRDIPRHSTSPGPIYGYSATVESLTDHEVTVSYGDVSTKTFMIDSLPLLTPETPGT